MRTEHHGLSDRVDNSRQDSGTHSQLNEASFSRHRSDLYHGVKLIRKVEE